MLLRTSVCISSVLIALCLFPVLCAGQTKTDYENAMKMYAKYYNELQSDSMYTRALSYSGWHDYPHSFSEKRLIEIQSAMGKIVSFKFLEMRGYDTQNRPMALFKVEYNKKSKGSNFHAMDFSLDSDNKIYGYGGSVSSPHIDSLMKAK